MASLSEDETVSALLRNALIDRMDPWELIEFLGIPMEQIIEDYEVEIVEHQKELEELVGIENDEEYE